MLDRLTHWLAGDRADDLVPTYFGFNTPLPLWICLALIALATLGIFWYYRRKLAQLPRGYRAVLLTLRAAALFLVVFLALDPVIVAQRIKPGEQFVVLLFDDSRSMRIAGEDGRSRGERLQAAYAAQAEEFEGALKRKHQIARYRFGKTIEPLQEMADLEFAQQESDLTGAVAAALRDMAGTNVSAIVMFSDGVQQTPEGAPAITDLPDAPPVYTVGVDSTAVWRDIEIGRIGVRRTEFDKSPVVLTADVLSTGLSGRSATVEALLGDRVVASKTIPLSEDRQESEVRLEFIPDREGWLEYQARVRLEPGEPVRDGEGNPIPPPGEKIEENNSRRFVVDNRKKDYKILYVSGRPNWENKFVRRALEEDEQLRMTSLVVISDAEQKFEFRGAEKTSLTNPLFEGFEADADRPRYDEAVFLRLGPDAKDLSGYPITPDSLFDFDLVIWGEVEREFFTMQQMELTRDFVEKRGGSLMLMGGPASFTAGNYAGSVIEPLLPVVLFDDESEANRFRETYVARPTLEGALTGAWSFHPSADQNEYFWNEMPSLYGLNRFALVRPGATVMAIASAPDGDLDGAPLYAVQPYGEGRCAALATGDTWQWQMRLEEKDDRHERFWRQLVRSLVQDVPDASYLRDKLDAYTQGNLARLEFVVRDEEFAPRESLRTSVTLSTPGEQEALLPVEESIQETGLYAAEFTPDTPGLYKVNLNAINDKDEIVGSVEEAVLVEPDYREYQLAQYNPQYLADLADHAGGEVYTLDRLAELAQSIPLPRREDADTVLLHLWHLPGFYVALILAMAIEWYLRRRKGYA